MRTKIIEKAVAVALNAPHKIVVDESWYFTFKNRYAPELKMLKKFVEKRTMKVNKDASDELGRILQQI